MVSDIYNLGSKTSAPQVSCSTPLRVEDDMVQNNPVDQWMFPLMFSFQHQLRPFRIQIIKKNCKPISSGVARTKPTRILVASDFWQGTVPRLEGIKEGLLFFPIPKSNKLTREGEKSENLERLSKSRQPEFSKRLIFST